MKKYIIERNIPNIGASTGAQLKAGSAKSNAALRQVGPDVQWVQSYVVNDKTFCVYLATDEEAIRKHAQISGFPASAIHEVKSIFGPETEDA